MVVYLLLAISLSFYAWQHHYFVHVDDLINSRDLSGIFNGVVLLQGNKLLFRFHNHLLKLDFATPNDIHLTVIKITSTRSKNTMDKKLNHHGKKLTRLY